MLLKELTHALPRLPDASCLGLSAAAVAQSVERP